MDLGYGKLRLNYWSCAVLFENSNFVLLEVYNGIMIHYSKRNNNNNVHDKSEMPTLDKICE